MSKNIHVAIASTTSLPGQLDRNLGQIADFAKQAGDDAVDLLLTPELSASGYGGFPEVEHPLEPSVPFSPDVNEMKRQPSELQFNFFEVKGVRCVISICADAGISDINSYFERNGVELLLGPCGAGGKREDRVTTADLHTEEGRARYLENFEKLFSPGRGVIECIQHRRALAAVNLCGYDGRMHHHAGHGMIINAMGEVEGFFHGIPNLDRQRPMYASGTVDVEDRLGNLS